MAIKFLNTVAVDTNVLYVDAASNEVGINTTSPAYALHVNGQIYSESSTYPVYYLKRNTSATGGSFSTLTGIASAFKLETDSSGTITDGFGGGIIFSIGDTSPNTAARIYARRDGGDQTGALQFWGGTNGNTLFTTMRASGNVGIGTEAPAEKLVVSEVRSGTNAAAQTKYTLVSRSTIASGQTPGTGGIKVAYNDGTNDHGFGLVAGSSSADFLTSGPMHWYTNSDLNTNNATGFAMTIDTSQRVGIGTTTPDVALDVDASTGIKVQNAGDVVFLANPSGTFSLGDAAAVGGGAYITSDSSNIDFFGDGNVRFRNEGKVGINVTDFTTTYGSVPDLRVGSSSGVNNPGVIDILRKDGTVVAGDIAGILQFSVDDDNNYAVAQIETESAATSGTGNSGGGILKFKTTPATSGGTLTERMRINSGGSVGIGEPSPAERLHISGSVDNDDVAIRIDNDSDDNSSSTPPSAAVLLNTASNNGYFRVFGAPADTAANHRIDIGATASSSYLTFSPSTTEKMRITSGGNVGIGTTIPNSILHIKQNTSGVSTSAGLTIEQDGAGDAIAQFLLTGVRRWVLGADNSDSDKFKLASTADLNTDALLTVVTGGNVGIGTTSPAEKLVVSDSNDVSVRINSTKNGTWTTDQVLGAYEFYGNDASGAGAQLKGKIDCASLNQYGAGFHMRFFTAGGSSGTSAQERMRIQSSGAVTIGKTAPSSYNTQGIELSPSGLGAFTRSGNVPLLVNRTGSDGTAVSIRNDNSQVGSISFSGSTTSFNTSSDYRLKENIIDLPNALDKIEQLKPKRFNFISEETTIDGFIAHEVQDVIPQAVFGEKDAVDEEGNPEYQQIDNSKIVPLLVGAIKELKAEIETLKLQINL